MEHLKTIKITLNRLQYEDLLLLATERGYHLSEDGEHLATTGNGFISPEMTVSQYVEEIVVAHLVEIRKSLVLPSNIRRVLALRELRALWQRTKRIAAAKKGTN